MNLFSLLFQTNFLRFTTDEETRALLSTTNLWYSVQTPRYVLKSPYPIGKLLLLAKNRTKPIITRVIQILSLSQLKQLTVLKTRRLLLSFRSNFNESIYSKDFADCNVKTLMFLDFSDFNQSVDDLPNTVSVIDFGFDFNQTVNLLPRDLLRLSFSYEFNKPIDMLPSNLRSLRLVYSFNQRIDNLPNSLIILILGESFNQPVDHLPLHLRQLIFARNFNQPVNYLPSTLTKLYFGFCFDQSIAHLPQSLSEVTFYHTFNRETQHLTCKVHYW
jgi:hypothetical protein